MFVRGCLFTFAVFLAIPNAARADSEVERLAVHIWLSTAVYSTKVCKLELNKGVAENYVKSKITAATVSTGDLATGMINAALGATAVPLVWGSTDKLTCSAMVSRFGPSGTDIPGLLTGPGGKR